MGSPERSGRAGARDVISKLHLIEDRYGSLGANPMHSVLSKTQEKQFSQWQYVSIHQRCTLKLAVSSFMVWDCTDISSLCLHVSPANDRQPNTR